MGSDPEHPNRSCAVVFYSSIVVVLFQAVAIVGAQLADLLQEEEQKQKFNALVVDAEWGLKLSKLGVSI